ncbi:MAG TPA: hypothetical protein VGM88_10190 [Kofleriaceae bacterium]|jgi:hypothetical protein
MKLVRLVSLGAALVGALSLGACGDDSGNGGQDAATGSDGSNSGSDGSGSDVDVGFKTPTAVLTANSGNTMVGPADLSCLGSANTDMALTTAATLNTTVLDFFNQTPDDGVTVTAFAGIDVGTPFDTQGPTDGTGAVSIHVPIGTKRFGIKMTQLSSLDTLLLNQYLDPAGGTQTDPSSIQIVSQSTGQLLPSLVGIDRTPGTGVLAGAFRDCQNHEVSNFIATVSSTEGTATPLTNANVFYFNLDPAIPERHSLADASTANGLFVALQLPVATTAYVQIWGFKSQADLTAGTLTLVGELALPVVADTVITGSYVPLRAN